MLKVRTLFSGIGSPESALKNIGIDYELVDFCEIDKYAVKSYCAVHGVSESKNLGDISKVWGRDLPYADLLVWGFPCTDISIAGKGKGMVEGVTRSGLYYEGYRVLKETKPKYSIIENVKNLTGKKFKAEFEQILEDMKGIGYNNYYKVLNAKDYGIPQNRERVFIVSIRADVDTHKFEFPTGFDNGLRLKDFLEAEVDEKFYLGYKTLELIKRHNVKIDKINGITQTAIDASYYKGIGVRCNKVRCCFEIETPCIAASRGRNIQNPSDRTPGNKVEQRLEINKNGTTNTLTTVQKDNYVLENKRTKIIGSTQRNAYIGDGQIPMIEKTDYRLRKLTPKECWRLMGFSDEEFQRAADAGVSNSQLYKQAGNSIYTGCLSGIFTKLLQADIQANIEEEKTIG